MKWSEIAQSCLTLCDPVYLPSMGFSRQEYWSGLPFPSPGDQKTRLYKLPRKQGAVEAIRPKDNPYQKRVINNPFRHTEKLMKEILCKYPISLLSVLGVACCSTHSWQKLIRNRELKRDKKQHTEILLLNIPWHFLNLFLYSKISFSFFLLFFGCGGSSLLLVGFL